MSDRSEVTRKLALAVSAGAVVILLGTLAFGTLSGGSVPSEAASDTTDSPAVTVEAVTNETTVTIAYTNDSGATREFVVEGVDPRLSSEEDGWAIVDRSALAPSLATIGGNTSDCVIEFGEYALVGRTSRTSVDIDNTTLTVVVPEGRDVDPPRKAGFVREFADPYSLAPKGSDQIVLVSVPDVLPSEGLMYHDDRGYVTTEAFWDGDAHSVWIHEYVHARQDFRTATGMTWFREASARYLSYRFMQEQYEGVSKADVRGQLDAYPNHEEVVLANRTTWERTKANYHDGARLLAAIDAEIRAGSGGDYTLVDVFRAMNAQEEPITVERFVSLVERYAGEDQSWIRKAITSEGGGENNFQGSCITQRNTLTTKQSRRPCSGAPARFNDRTNP